jgi:hypothetical protein
MKVILFVLIFTPTIFSQGVDYFPVHIGDTWEWYSSTNDTIYESVITKINVLSDSSLDVFYNESNTPRYRLSKEGKVYQHLTGSLVLWYDFSVTPGDTFEVVIYSAPYYVIVDSTEDFLFGENITIRTFNWVNQNTPSLSSHQRLAQEYGVYKTISFLGPSDDFVIGCIIGGNGYGTLVSVKEDNVFYKDFNLKQNYPNPFNSFTTIEYSIPKSSNVVIKIYNSLGEEINEIENSYRESGNYKIIFGAKDLVSGIYYYQLITDNFQETKKFIYLK